LFGAGMLAGNTPGVLTGCSSSCGCIKPFVKRKYVLADIHNHTVLNEWLRNTPIGVKSPMLADFAKDVFDKTSTTWQSAYEAGIDLICTTHFNLFDEWISMATDPNPSAPANTFRMMDLLEKDLNGPSAKYARLIRTPEEFRDHFNKVDKNNENYRIAVLHSLEGGHALGGSIEPLEEFALRGVVLITIGHFYNKGIATAPNSFPFFPDSNSPWPNQGLSSFGKEVIYEMERLGIIVDVTHASSTALEEILKVSTKPLIATHTSVKTLGDHAYSFHDEHIQEITRRGGMIGIPIYPYMLSNYANVEEAEKHGSLRDVVRTIRYVTKICDSTNNVCIGSDFGAYIPSLTDMNCLCQIDLLHEMLEREFGNEETVDDLLAKNVIEFLGNNWKRNL